MAPVHVRFTAEVFRAMRWIRDLKTSVGAVLKIAAREGVLIDAGKTHIEMLPLDDDLLDFLLERSPKLIKECKKIRAEMKRGKYTTHEDVKKMFAKDLKNARANGQK